MNKIELIKSLIDEIETEINYTKERESIIAKLKKKL